MSWRVVGSEQQQPPTCCSRQQIISLAYLINICRKDSKLINFCFLFFCFSIPSPPLQILTGNIKPSVNNGVRHKARGLFEQIGCETKLLLQSKSLNHFLSLFHYNIPFFFVSLFAYYLSFYNKYQMVSFVYIFFLTIQLYSQFTQFYSFNVLPRPHFLFLTYCYFSLSYCYFSLSFIIAYLSFLSFVISFTISSSSSSSLLSFGCY
ncbi:unnamed protein product [Acanthosepion pharaonis]|uniref:Uncharacterized protein n=1 Tax=Acanthosepion pharaonis TaxID=158019 RepID=A0A812DIA8_ACAPH|nr:unnamed protein product [Sepia pharaonis]